ncbi:MAG TPA: PmoA family protein [Gemmataceae bacterium]|nr:PmoA family protein [Gemmataceae bacterium]
MKPYLAIPLAVLVAAVWLLPVPAAEPQNVTITVSDDHIDFLAGKELIGRYNKGPNVAKPYMWPVHGPGGVPLTRAWPMMQGQPGESTDHVHQKSLWFCHGDVIPEGIPIKEKIKGVEGVDFWSENKGAGRIVCTRVETPTMAKNHGRVTTSNEWRTADGQKILDEQRTIHLYDLGDAKLFVFDIELHASVCPITFGDTKEGSFGIRINDAIREEMVIDKKRVKGPGQIENAEGKIGEKQCWGQVSAWCDYSGPLEGKTVGLAILADPANPVPSCWHARGYGLMAANPFGRSGSGFPAMKGKTDLVKLEKGGRLKLRYGVLLHPGDAKTGKVAEYFERFVKLRG